MNEFLESIGVAPGSLPLIVLAATLLFYLLYKPFITNPFDPIIMFLIGMVADTALVFALPWIPELKWEYVFFSLSLYLGFVLSRQRFRPTRTIRFARGDLYDLEAILWILLVIVIVANLYLGISTGFPLLSASPSAAKVTAYSGGTGLVRRINMGPYLFFCCGCIYMAFMGVRRRRAVTMLLLSTVFIALSGSKGALLPLVYTQALLLAHPGLGTTKRLAAKTNRYMSYTLLAGVFVALAVTTRDKGTLTAGLAAFGQRILLTGDVVLYYFGGRERVFETSARSVLGFVDYLFNDSLAMIRLADYQEPLGSVLVGAGNNGFGPNAQYFVPADLFFGPLWGCVYSAVIGYAVGKLRAIFFQASGSSAITFVIKLTLAVSAFNLVWEAAMFVQIFVSIALTVGPLWIFVRFLRKTQFLVSPGHGSLSPSPAPGDTVDPGPLSV